MVITLKLTTLLAAGLYAGQVKCERYGWKPQWPEALAEASETSASTGCVLASILPEHLLNSISNVLLQ
jgi:hypothetical protein